MRNHMAHMMMALAIASPTLAAEPGKAQLQKVPALRETQVNGAQGENAHGVAIWNPQDKSKARVIGGQPQGELNIYDMNGVILQRLGIRAPRAVDVRNHFTWIESDGAILAATDNSDRSIVFYKLDPKTGLADPKSRGRIRTNSYQQVSEPLYRRAAGRWERYRPWLEPVLPLLQPHIDWLGYATP